MAHYLELQKFTPQNRVEKKLHELWLRFLTEVNENTKEIPKELLENDFTREAVGYMERAAYTKEQLAAYDKWKIAAMTERSAINDAKREGLAEGEAIGMEKGETERAKLKAELEAAQAEKEAAQAEKEAAKKNADEQAARIAELERMILETKTKPER